MRGARGLAENRAVGEHEGATMFPIRTVDRSQAQALEPLGSKSKFWFREGDTRFLFKADSRGTGEDWAEVIAFHLARLLGLPCVKYELASETENEIRQAPGVICENMAPPPLELVLGNQLLLAIDPAYPAEERYKMRQHTVAAVVDALTRIEMPDSAYSTSLPAGIASAPDVFVGYVMLDAWIANQDRHHENWGAIWDGKILALAPTFDHGAALARNIRDEERADRLTSKDTNRGVAKFVGRARSAFFETPEAKRPMSTLAAFRAFAQEASHAADLWLQQLAKIEEADVWRIIQQVPPDRLSSVGKDFTLRLLIENNKRLLS